jgi:hypothetical protein
MPTLDLGRIQLQRRENGPRGVHRRDFHHVLRLRQARLQNADDRGLRQRGPRLHVSQVVFYRRFVPHYVHRTSAIVGELRPVGCRVHRRAVQPLAVICWMGPRNPSTEAINSDSRVVFILTLFVHYSTFKRSMLNNAGHISSSWSKPILMEQAYNPRSPSSPIGLAFGNFC